MPQESFKKLNVFFFVLSNYKLILFSIYYQKLYGDDDEEKHFPGGVIMLLTDGLDSSDWITDEIEENIRNRTVTVMSVALG